MIARAEDRESLLSVLRRSLSSAKIVQNFDLASQMRIYSLICEREKFIQNFD